jgi:hypothetical protein
MASVISSSRRLTLSTLDTASALVGTVHLGVNALHERAVVWHNQNAYECAALQDRARNATLAAHCKEALEEAEELHNLLYPGTQFDREATLKNLIARLSAVLDNAKLA